MVKQFIGTGQDQVPVNGMLGDLAFQSKESVTFTDGDGRLSALTLNPIYKQITATASDVFVYDTSKDSDGGAWRKRCQHLTWYNETLNTSVRGSRKDFPSVAVIVGSSTTLTIYDGDDPSLPMWIVFTVSFPGTIYGMMSGSNGTGIAALNGIVGVAGGAFPRCFSFVHDTGWLWDTSGRYSFNAKNLADRNAYSSAGTTPQLSGSGLVSATGNDFAMTVLPSSPVDSTTGLPLPTMAIATPGGVSIIKDDGTTVVNITCSNTAFNYVHWVGFTKGNRLALLYSYIGATDDTHLITTAIPTTSYQHSYHSDAFNAVAGYSRPCVMPIYANSGGTTGGSKMVVTENTVTLGNISGLGILSESLDNSNNSLVANITKSSTTGWMVGNIKGAWLCDAVPETIIQTDLVVDGGFESAANFTLIQGSATVTRSATAARTGSYGLICTSTGGSNVYSGREITGLVPGKAYTFSVDYNNLNHTTSVILNTAWANTGTLIVGDGSLGASASWQTLTTTFIATTTSVWLNVFAQGTIYIDNLSLKPADGDRSVNNKGLTAFGNPVKTPVAPGAELVGYSFATTSDYFEQPYNSAIGGVGTGDFCVMGWFKNSPTSSTWFDIASDTSPRFFVSPMYGSVNNVWIYMNTAAGTFNWQPSPTLNVLNVDQWQFIAVKRSGTTISVSLNGGTWFDNNTVSAGGNMNGVSKLTIGQNYTHGAAAHTGQMALWRFTQTCPTNAQIAKIYADEKELFLENAKCTLYGTSNAVTGLGYDLDTKLLHVGTSSGRSVFQGLRRVDNTTTAVSTAISAANGLVAEQ